MRGRSIRKARSKSKRESSRRIDKLLPPIEKYCVVCEKKRYFQFIRKINHSECMKCGARYGQLIK